MRPSRTMAIAAVLLVLLALLAPQLAQAQAVGRAKRERTTRSVVATAVDGCVPRTSMWQRACRASAR